MTYRPRWVGQLVGTSPLRSENCGMASAAMALDRATLGAKTATAEEMRARQRDQVGGTDLNDVALAIENSGEQITVLWGDSYDHFRNWVSNGRGAVLSGDYYVIANRLSCQPNFDKGHAIYVNEYSAAFGFYCYDPLCDGRRSGVSKGAKWYPEAMIRAYGASFAGQGKMSAAYTNVVGANVISFWPGFGSDANLRDAAAAAGLSLRYLLLLILILVGLWVYTRGMPRPVTFTEEGT